MLHSSRITFTKSNKQSNNSKSSTSNNTSDNSKSDTTVQPAQITPSDCNYSDCDWGDCEGDCNITGLSLADCGSCVECHDLASGISAE